MSNKRNRRGAKFFHSHGQSIAATCDSLQESIFWPHRNNMSWSSWKAMTDGYEAGDPCFPGSHRRNVAVDIESIGVNGRPAVTVVYSTPNGPVSQVFQDKYEHYRRNFVRENDVSQDRFEIPVNDWSN